MGLTRKQKLERLELLEERQRRQRQQTGTIIGIVHPDGHLLRKLRQDKGRWVETLDGEPQAFFAAALEPMLTRPKRFTVVIGGRSSGKSVAMAGLGAIDVHDNGASWMCLREFQSSIRDSVHGLIKAETDRLELPGFTVGEQTIKGPNGGEIRFNGLARNTESVKSSFGFTTFYVEESQFISSDSLKLLTPTARNAPVKGLPTNMQEVGEDEVDLTQVRLIFVGNPMSSKDPFSERFVVPYLDALNRDGIYEDDLHCIIKMNYTDNPWHGLSGVDSERQWDYEHLPRALYDHIWLGGFNDHILNAIITGEMFDAAVDSAKVLGFEPRGLTVTAHDPSDLGDDPKATVVRRGSCVLAAVQGENGDVNEGADDATALAIEYGSDAFVWDSSGMGVSLRRQVASALHGKRCDLEMFNGAETPADPDVLYEPIDGGGHKHARSNREVFKNRRAQAYWNLRDRFYKTWLAVEKGQYHDPDDLISIPSDLPELRQLRAEICRIPLKPNPSGVIQIMRKDEMAKLQISSPNLGDSLMMAFAYSRPVIETRAPVQVQQPITTGAWG